MQKPRPVACRDSITYVGGPLTFRYLAKLREAIKILCKNFDPLQGELKDVPIL